MKKPISILLAAAMLLLSAPGSAYAVDTLTYADPADQIESPDEKLSPAEVERIIREFLRDEMHFNEAVTCGILANIYVECKFDPGDSYEEAGGFTSYGICQWNRTRLQGLVDFCAEHGYDPSDLMGQLRYMKHELMTSESYAYRMIRTISNDAAGAYQAGLYFASYYERSNPEGRENRANIARNTFWPVYGRHLPVGLNVPYYPAAGNDSLTACLAMAEGYLAGYPSGDTRVTDGLTGLDLSELYTEETADFETIFTALHQGIPVILKDASGMYSLIYGYDGESDVPEAEGLRTLIPTASEQVMPGSYGHLSGADALESCTILLRSDLKVALPICDDDLSGLTLTGFAHPVGLPEGGNVLLGGRLTSDKNLSGVEITLTDAEGRILASTSAALSDPTLDLATLPALTGASELPAGDYTLTLTAKDESGAILGYSAPFAVSELPLAGRIGESSADPLSGEEPQIPGLYRITAESGLRVRSIPSTEGEQLTAIPWGFVVTVTELTDTGWGKTVYNGREGWIFMEYAEFVSGIGIPVTYHANGGTGAPAVSVKQSGEALTLPEAAPVRTGYRFVGWSLNPVASDAEYLPGDLYTDDQAVTFYAVWEEIVPVYGDVTGDGTVNMRDIVLLQQYLNGYDVKIDFIVSDLDADGAISMRDITLLQRHLNETE